MHLTLSTPLFCIKLRKQMYFLDNELAKQTTISQVMKYNNGYKTQKIEKNKTNEPKGYKIKNITKKFIFLIQINQLRSSLTSPSHQQYHPKVTKKVKYKTKIQIYTNN